MSFDPYHQWLGIPPIEQPPNHYRLLGVAVFESDRDVISNAAYRQLAHVKTYQLGQHVADSQRLLSEIVTARACLMDAESRAAYDAQLRDAISPPAAPPTEAPRVVVTEPLADQRDRRGPPLALVTPVVVVVFGVVLSIAILSQPFAQPNTTDRTVPSAGDVTFTKPPDPARSTMGQAAPDIRVRSGLEFDGDAWVETDLLYDGRTPLTIEVWVTPAVHDLRSIVANCHGLGVSLQMGQDGHWQFAVRDKQTYRVASSNEVARLGELAHVAGVFDGRIVRLFVNGRLQDAVGTLTSDHKVSNLRFMIGADPDFNSSPQKQFEGSIDSVHVSHAVLYESDFDPPDPLVRTPSTALLLQLDEGAGEVAADSSVHEQHATIHGAKWTSP